MKKVDFLPTRYHETTVRRRATVWRYLLLVVFGGIICAATCGQLAIKQSVRAQLAGLRKQHQAAREVKETAAEFHQELRKTEEIAELYTYLRHPWPRTQLLAHVTQRLPESVVISELRINQHDEQANAQHSTPASPAAADDAGETSPAKQDLQDLRSTNDSNPTQIQVKGTARDPVVLNDYVEALGESPLFKSAKLTFLEAVHVEPDHLSEGNESANRGVSRFDVLIAVIPGYGTPDGPTAPLAESDRVDAELASAETPTQQVPPTGQLAAEVQP